MNLIASMTTYPARFKYAQIAIESIYYQTKRPDIMVINIAEKDWNEANKNFIHENKEKFPNWIVFDKCIDLKPAKKIIPTAKKYKDSSIITFDDDIIYPKDRVEIVFKKHIQYPNNPIAYRVREVSFKNDRVSPYSSWTFPKNFDDPKKTNFGTNGACSLFPINFFSNDFFNIEKYIKLSYTADDIWIYFHVLKQNSAFVQAGFEPVPPTIPGSQKISPLWKHNVSRGNNDYIINNLEKEYGTIYELAGMK